MEENCFGKFPFELPDRVSNLFDLSHRIRFSQSITPLLFSLSTGASRPFQSRPFLWEFENSNRFESQQRFLENPFPDPSLCERDRERECTHAKFLALHFPLHSSRSRRWRYHYSVAVISVACGGTTLAREIKTSGFYVAWDDGSWPVYWSWPPLRAGTRRGALAPRPALARLCSPPRNASKAIEDRVDRICQSSCYLFLLFLLFRRLLFRVNLSFLLTRLVICLVISSIW